MLFEEDDDHLLISIGDKVKVVSAINFDTGRPFDTHYDKYDVIEVDNYGRRIVIGIEDTIIAVIAIENLIKIK